MAREINGKKSNENDNAMVKLLLENPNISVSPLVCRYHCLYDACKSNADTSECVKTLLRMENARLTL